MCQVANLGEQTVRRIAKESGAVRKIGKSYRIRKDVFMQKGKQLLIPGTMEAVLDGVMHIVAEEGFDAVYLDRCAQWQCVKPTIHGTYSSGYCSGFAPDSLLILTALPPVETLRFVLQPQNYAFLTFHPNFHTLYFPYFFTPVWISVFWSTQHQKEG